MSQESNRKVMAPALLLAVLASALAIGYLFQHRYNVRLTRQVVMLAKERQLLAESLDVVDVGIARLEDFGRLDSLWMARSGRTAPAVAAAPQPEPRPEHVVAAVAPVQEIRGH